MAWPVALFSILGMGGLVMGILVWQEGGEYVGLLIALGLVSLASLGFWLVNRKRSGKVPLLDPDLDDRAREPPVR